MKKNFLRKEKILRKNVFESGKGSGERFQEEGEHSREEFSWRREWFQKIFVRGCERFFRKRLILACTVYSKGNILGGKIFSGKG